MTRRDWLLLLIGLEGAPEGLDPVRVQKGMFLLAREGGLAGAERYAFRAYNYGPMSPRLYRDLDGLVRRGLVERLPVRGYGWSRVTVTPAGADHVSRLHAEAGPAARASIERLAAIKRTIVGLSFSELLETVYSRYPAYASRSVFRRP